MVTQLRKKIVRFPKTKKIFPFTIVVIVLLLSSNFYLSRTFFTFHASAQSTGIAAISGEMKKWHPVTLSFTGPQANETDGQAIQPTI